VADFERELRRMAANHLLSQLTRNHSTGLKRALASEVEIAWLARPTTEDFGVPA
jgi:hypothetical protein